VQTIDGTQGGGIAFLNVVDVAVDAGNNIRVIETDIVTFDGRLRSFDTNGDPISPTVTLDQPKSVAIDSSGKSVVVEGFTFTIATRNLDGALDSSFPTTGNSLSVAVGQDGNYLLGQSPVRVRQFSPPAGTLLQTIGASDFTGSSVDAVAVDHTPDGSTQPIQQAAQIGFSFSTPMGRSIRSSSRESLSLWAWRLMLAATFTCHKRLPAHGSVFSSLISLN